MSDYSSLSTREIYCLSSLVNLRRVNRKDRDVKQAAIDYIQECGCDNEIKILILRKLKRLYYNEDKIEDAKAFVENCSAHIEIKQFLLGQVLWQNQEDENDIKFIMKQCDLGQKRAAEEYYKHNRDIFSVIMSIN